MTITSTDILCVNRKTHDQLPRNHEKILTTAMYNFTQGCNGTPTSWEEARDYHDNTIILYGAQMIKAVKHCWENDINFFYIDNGYIGNVQNKKQYHRVIQNHVHDLRPIIERPRDRLQSVIWFIEWIRSKSDRKANLVKPTLLHPKPFAPGRSILVAPPSPKSFTLWDIDQEQWIEETVNEIKKHTDRPIRIRLKRARDERFVENTMEEDLKECHCLVTYNSVSALEALINGKPAFTLGPNAAQHLCYDDLAKIENPYIPHSDEVDALLRHLSYSQFTRKEMASGAAWDILNG
jgi:hypothetical protein